MNLKERLNEMMKAGFRLPKNCYSLHEAKVSVNPKTGAMQFKDIEGNLWGYDKVENHFDVLSRDRKYMQVSLDGYILGIKQSTLAYTH